MNSGISLVQWDLTRLGISTSWKPLIPAPAVSAFRTSLLECGLDP